MTTPRADIARRKRAVRLRARAARTCHRQRRLFYWKCFWTWPWGHAWESVPVFTYYKRCAVCGKLRDDDGQA